MDNGGPVFESQTAKESWNLIDTVIMWSNNLADIRPHNYRINQVP
jgi:hypothetical protein